jgi:chloramphenicol O-acetyltransferase type A
MEQVSKNNKSANEEGKEDSNKDPLPPPIEKGHTEIDLESWPRKDVFAFYKDSPGCPMWGVTVRLKVTRARQICKAQGWSYLQASLFLLGQAVNAYAPMRYRMRRTMTENNAEETKVICHEWAHMSFPILRRDGSDTYGFCLLESSDSFAAFRRYAARVVEDFHNAGLNVGMNKSFRDDVLHGSILPWIDFTSYEHAIGKSHRHDIPKYVFGKLVHDEPSDTWDQAFCFHVHHALVDGLHMGRFLELLQKQFDQAEHLLLT